MSTLAAASVSPATTLAGQIADLVFYEGRHAPALNRYPEGFSEEDILTNREAVVNDLGEKEEACLTLVREYNRIKGLVDGTSELDSVARRVFTAQLADMNERLEGYKKKRDRCRFDLITAHVFVHAERELAELAKRVRTLVTGHATLLKRDREALYQAFYDVNRGFQTIPLESQECHVPLQEAWKLRLEADRAVMGKLLDELATSFGDGIREEIFLDDHSALRSPVLPSSPHAVSFQFDLKGDARVWNVLQLCDAALRLEIAMERSEIVADLGRAEIEVRLRKVKAELAEGVKLWDSELRTELYTQVYFCSPQPKGGDSWGEHNVVKNMKVTVRAVDLALSKHPDLSPISLSTAPKPPVDVEAAKAERACRVLHALRKEVDQYREIGHSMKTTFAAIAFERAKEQWQEIDPSLAAQIEQGIYGGVFAFSEDPDKAGLRWGQEHAMDDLSVFTFAVLTASIPLMLK
jgi:hypothetical protein